MNRRFEVHRTGPGYPAHLLTAVRPPRLLYGIGDPAALVPGLAIIGSRKATPYGLSCARMFAGVAADAGVTVISGAAIGCDLAAHRAALDAGGRTIAVLGCGADVDYPRRAAQELRSIREGSGAVVSELDWGVPPLPGHFPARNRIIAGLAAAVLVVEASLPSGTFSTADSALDSGRDVLAVPGSILYAGSAGSNRLIRQGAEPITCARDLLEALSGAGLTVVDRAPTDCTDERGASPHAHDPLLEALRAHPMSPDEAAGALGIGPSEALASLARFEAAGLIGRYADGRYGPCAVR